ncbi:hypothetical protein ACROYT_G028690 [Oculina patagonica]
MKEIEKFYSDLYASNDESVNRNHPFLQRAEIPKLSDEMRRICEGRLSLKECFDCLQSFQNNKSPGNDGLTVEFYKTFWNSIGNLVVDCLNSSYECGELSNTQKQAIITLIEKKGKDKRNIGNWRPISLINVDAKIGSKAIALRLQKVLAEIIHFNQNAYVKGRTILDAVRTIDDILEYTERKKINGLLVGIDFQKAFDSVNRNFMVEALSAFNFGPSLIHWVQTFYKNISSTVMNNGYTTTPFQVLRGVRQGDPLSPYLFIICLEILAINVRLNENIKGIIVDKEEIKLEIFADDLTSFLRDRTSLNALFETIDCFSSCSGLKVNYEKTEAMWLGNHNPNPPTLASCSDRNITVKKVVKILGIHFTYNQILWKKLNFDEVLKSISEKLHFWNWRNLTILGRIQIVKTFVVPIFMYRAGLVCMHKDIIKETNKILFNFIWKGKDKVKRSSLVSDVENGGLRAPHLESAIKTQRIMCCKKFVDSQQILFLLFPEPSYSGPDEIHFFGGPALNDALRDDPSITWLVEFYAPWCPPCVRFAPTFAELSLRYNHSHLRFGKLDVGKYPIITEKHKVDGSAVSKQLPSFSAILYEGGKETKRRPLVDRRGVITPYTFTEINIERDFNLKELKKSAEEREN